MLRKSLNVKNSVAEAATEVFCKEGVLRNFPKFTGKHCTRVSMVAASAVSKVTG